MTVVWPWVAVLSLYVAAICYVHFRGRVRLRRQLTDHSSLFAPYNVLMYLCSAVPRRPVLDAGDFPALQPLRDNWQVIRDEAARLVSGDRLRPAAAHDDIAFNSFFRRGWCRFYVKWYGAALPSAEALCPETVRLVQSIPSVNAALFALLPPGGRLAPHRDPFAGSLRYHLGLLTPNSDRCHIQVDAETRFWRDGEALVFDETYVHRAFNDTDEPRVILFCDVTRPLRFAPVRWLNRLVARHVVPLTAARNETGETIGVVNRLAPHVYQTGRFFRTVKKTVGRRAYYGAKYALFAALLATLCWAALGWHRSAGPDTRAGGLVTTSALSE
jgi:beta-hydroxylase